MARIRDKAAYEAAQHKRASKQTREIEAVANRIVAIFQRNTDGLVFTSELDLLVYLAESGALKPREGGRHTGIDRQELVRKALVVAMKNEGVLVESNGQSLWIGPRKEPLSPAEQRQVTHARYEEFGLRDIIPNPDLHRLRKLGALPDL